AYVRSEFNGKFDGTLGAFANDVASRANKIRADAAARGDDISMDDARQQAIEQLRPFIKTTEAASEGYLPGVPLVGGIGKHGATLTYSRSSTKQPAVDAAGEKQKEANAQPVALPPKGQALTKGVIYQTQRGPAVWDGEKFVKQ